MIFLEFILLLNHANSLNFDKRMRKLGTDGTSVTIVTGPLGAPALFPQLFPIPEPGRNLKFGNEIPGFQINRNR